MKQLDFLMIFLKLLTLNLLVNHDRTLFAVIFGLTFVNNRNCTSLYHTNRHVSFECLVVLIFVCFCVSF